MSIQNFVKSQVCIVNNYRIMYETSVKTHIRFVWTHQCTSECLNKEKYQQFTTKKIKSQSIAYHIQKFGFAINFSAMRRKKKC